MSAEDRIIDKARSDLAKKIAEDEAHWIVRKLGHAVVCFPHIVKELFLTMVRPELEWQQAEIDRLKAEVDALREGAKKVDDRLNNAGKLVKEIDQRTRPKAAQPQRR
jgi:hypothetical protein